jgi:hypothetical protein
VGPHCWQSPSLPAMPSCPLVTEAHTLGFATGLDSIEELTYACTAVAAAPPPSRAHIRGPRPSPPTATKS